MNKLHYYNYIIENIFGNCKLVSLLYCVTFYFCRICTKESSSRLDSYSLDSFSFWKRKNISGKSLGQVWLTLRPSNCFIDIYEYGAIMFYPRILFNGFVFV